MKIAIGSDHAGFDLKTLIKEQVNALGHELVDLGPHAADSVDYPDFGHPVAKAVEDGTVDLGILMCGSGNGINMTANKHQGIRAALCWIPQIASLARQHNDANVLVLPARFIEEDMAHSIVDAFLSASFEAGRHERRVAKIACTVNS